MNGWLIVVERLITASTARLSRACGCSAVASGRAGRGARSPTPEEALEELGSETGPTRPETGEWPRIFVGDPERIRDQLIDMASVLHLDEVMVVTVVHDHQARVRSYQLLAEAFDLKPRAEPPPLAPK